MTDEIIIPELSPAEQRASRMKDILLMRSLDVSLGVQRYQITNIMTELNIRIIQYTKQWSYSLDALIIQTLQDYRQYLTPCYELSNAGILLRTRPVAILKGVYAPVKHMLDVYANPYVVKSDFETGVILLFINDLAEAKEPERQTIEIEETETPELPNEDDIPF